MNIRRVILILLLVFGAIFTSRAEGTRDDVENLYKYRMGVDFQIKLMKGLKLNLEPEFRFYEGFDKLMLNGGLTYKTLGCIYIGATYRLEVDRTESQSSSSSYFGYGSSYSSELYHRYAFDLTYKDEFHRFTPSFRLRYNNFADDEITNREFLRYRGKVEYNIRKCKLTPFVSVEAFQELEEMMLYKMRYSTGFDYKVNKVSSFSLDYKLDFFNLKYRNTHIFSAGYKCRF